jgi:hypothetical protein
MTTENLQESRRALAHAAHKYYHQSAIAGRTADFRGESTELAGMNTAGLRDYVWLWKCPDLGDCAWMKWWETEQSNDA